MFVTNIVPGQGFSTYHVHKKIGGLTSSGKPKQAEITDTGIEFYGMLVNASQKEKEEWKQNKHPITHKIIEYSAMAKAKATDYLVKDDDRHFYVQGIKNPADMNVTMIYYVEERFDIKGKPVPGGSCDCDYKEYDNEYGGTTVEIGG